MQFLKFKFNRLKYYFKVLVWAQTHQKQVGDYRFLLDLKKSCHKRFLEAERKKLDEVKNKAKIQEDLIINILNHVG